MSKQHIISTVGKISGWPEDKSYKKLWRAIEFQLSVARNGYELNAWVSLLTTVCNLTHNRCSHSTMIEPKRNY